MSASITNTEEWIDISVTLQNGIVNWPGDPEFKIHFISEIDDGDEVNISAISSCVHIGTHVDAPLHYLKNGNDVTSLPLATLIGVARVIAIQNNKIITKEELSKYGIKKGERILFKTLSSKSKWALLPFNSNYIALSTSAATYLAESGILLVGIDYLSIACMDNSAIVHQTLLEKQICILEGLDLSLIEEGVYDMICLPLKIAGAEGSPARVVLKKQSVS